MAPPVAMGRAVSCRAMLRSGARAGASGRAVNKRDAAARRRETLRPGKKFGSRIEDVGVTADYIVRPQVKDFNPYATTFTYFETIAEKLIEIGKESDTLDLNCTFNLT